MKNQNKIIVHQQGRYTIHGVVGLNNRVKDYTVTPDSNNVYSLFSHAQTRVVQLTRADEKREEEIKQAEREAKKKKLAKILMA